MTTKPLYWLLLPIFLAFLTVFMVLFGYWADDSLIACRYAENLVDFGQLVYNKGDFVSALTSPMHALLEALLYKGTGHTFLAWQVTAFVCLIISVLLIMRRFKDSPYSMIVVPSILLISPCVILWSYGGLETDLLLLWVTLLCLTAWTGKPMKRARLCLVFFLAGICFFTRYDSCLFTAPVVLYVIWRNRKPADIILAAILGAIIPLAWLIFSKVYYGDIYPTPFYVKPPVLHLHNIRLFVSTVWKNGSYMAQYFFLIGFLPLLLFLFISQDKTVSRLAMLRDSLRSMWGIYAGLVMMVCYGFATANIHMMYSFRLFVPYIPALVIVLADAYSRLQPESIGASSRISRNFTILIIALALFQTWQAWYTDAHSVDGAIVRIADYEGPRIGARAHVLTCENLRLATEDIRKHWESLPNHPARPPRIWTFAAGATPYYYRDAYVLETLTSYRRYCKLPLKPCADYIQEQVLTGKTIQSLLPGPESDFTLISLKTNPLNPNIREVRVYYNPRPLDNPLPSRVNDQMPARP